MEIGIFSVFNMVPVSPIGKRTERRHDDVDENSWHGRWNLET